MSFGKDPLPEGMPGFRAAAAEQNATKPTYEKKRIPSFIGAFKPNSDFDSVLRVIRATYENEALSEDGSRVVTVSRPWYSYRVHKKKALSKRGVPYDREMSICSAGPRHTDARKRNPCQGCDLLDAQFKSGIGKNGEYSVREYHAFSILQFGLFVKKNQHDDNGQVRMSNTGNPLWEWAEVSQAVFAQYPEEERSEALKRHWSMGGPHRDTLLAREGLISSSCLGCGVKGGKDGRNLLGIRTEMWLCASCQDSIIDMSETDMSPSEIERISLGKVICPKCNHTGHMHEMISCSHCSTPRRASIWDVDLVVKMSKPDGGGFPSLIIQDHSAPRPIDERYKELAVPFNFAGQVFRPHTIEEQKEIYGAPSLTPGSKPYGAKKG